MTEREQLAAAQRLLSLAATPNRGHAIMDEIRSEVWDYLFKNGPASLETIARASGGTVQTIQAATDHEWFAMRGDVVAIATHEESRGEEIRSSEEESSQNLRNLFGSEDRPSER